jgi:hypothetical protein
MVAAPFTAVRPLVVPDDVAPAFVRSVQRWSRAYPRRWRVARGDEMLGVLVDLSAPGRRRLDIRSALDLVRGGWATRLRERPPLGPWLLYRLFGTRSLRDHLGWVADDIAGALFPLRQGLLVWVVIIVPTEVTRVWAGGISFFSTWWFWTVVAIALSLEYLLPGGYGRRAAIETHLLARTGERVTAGSWVRVRALRRRVTARAALPWAVAASASLLVACVVAAALAPRTLRFELNGPREGLGFDVLESGAVPRGAVLAALGLALAAGVVLASVARTRLRRPRPRADQPHRELERVGVRRAAPVVLGVAVLAAMPIAEALGALPLALGLGLGIAAAVLAPPAVVAWLVVRQLSGAGELAFVDVRRIGLVGRAPRVDGPSSALTPAQPSEVGAVWPWPWSTRDQTPALG